LNDIARQDPEILQSVLDVMEVENLVASGAEIEVVPENSQILLQLNGETKG
jgi:hypothetical protein